MVYSSEDTKRRLLDAALAEFVEHGLAGARVDRIARQAGANKQAIYAYFGSKDALFDAVLSQRLSDLSDLVPFTPRDLPGYAVRLFDQIALDPRLQRLARWKELQRAAAPSEGETHRAKVAALAEGLGVGEETADDLLAMVLALVQAWGSEPGGAQGSRHGRAGRRGRLREAVSSVVAALGGSGRP